MSKKLILIILDGWGVAESSSGNAIAQAATPTIDSIEKNYFSTTLQASGIAVGLPWGVEGNSEVGHMNLGSGRIVYQYLPRIVRATRDGSFFKNKTFLRAVEFAKRNNSTLHLMGLLSSGSVHSYVDHLYALMDLAKKNGVKNVVLHLFTDGKDSSPKEASTFIQNLQERLNSDGVVKIGTVMGRVYAMDRANNWNLTQNAYEAMVLGKGEVIEDPVDYLKKSYINGKTDFTIEPAIVYENSKPVGLVSENDALIFFNFREDSARQITKAFVMSDGEFNYFPRKKIPGLFFVGMTMYQKDLPIEVAFPPPTVEMSLAETISGAGKTQLHIAETEKYAHITYFFNGEREDPHEGEQRILIPSQGTPHYEELPEMQAYNITQSLYENIDNYDFFILNFANADMLSHTGDFTATMRGIEAIDANLASILELAKKVDATLVITSDHGHAEVMLNPKTGEVKTGHSSNPVPLYIVDEQYKIAQQKQYLYERSPAGVLADVAPTILKLLGLEIPPQMTGKPLI